MALPIAPRFPVALRTWIDRPAPLYSGAAPAAPPFIPVETAGAVRARQLRPGIDPPNLLNTTLGVAPAPPFFPVDIPRPRGARWVIQDPTWPNLLSTTLVPVVGSPFTPTVDSRPAWRRPQVFDTIWPNLVVTTLAPAAGSPFLPPDLPGAPRLRRIMPESAWPNIALTRSPPPPQAFAQYDYPLPIPPRRSIGMRTFHDRSLPVLTAVVVAPPTTMRDFRLPIRKPFPRGLLGFVHQNPAMTGWITIPGVAGSWQDISQAQQQGWTTIDGPGGSWTTYRG